MSQKVAIKFPNSLKDWHLYSPEDPENLGPTHMVTLLPKVDIIKYQNQLQKFLYLWKKKFEILFPISFIIDSFSAEQISYQDYNSKNTNYIIYKVKDDEFFFSLQIDSTLAKLLLNQSFGVTEDQPTELAYSELEQVVFQQFFKDTFMKVLTECSVIGNQSEYEAEYGKKEKNGLIHSSEGYYVFKFSLLVSSQEEPCQVLFSFTKDNLEMFFDRLKFKHKFQKILINPTIQKDMYTNVEVKFGQANITLGELQSIQSGDVLLLKKSIGDPVDAVIGDELKFTAEFGLHKNIIAIKLLKQILEEKELILPQLESLEGDEELFDTFSEELDEEEENDFTSVLDDSSDDDEAEDSEEEDDDDYDWESL